MHGEFETLDTVWFMSGSLFNKYPYDVPTEAFSFEIFRQAFCAVQAAVVHLQARRPLGLLTCVPYVPPSKQERLYTHRLATLFAPPILPEFLSVFLRLQWICPCNRSIL
jgi:hypothetical protein